ncbi:MAG: molybdopterin cofactor-binding domain-containing protein [Burkholderiales bacterium]|nr:molybdopterin cofactor-binding domain-containing protein [Burkholderiales bacterium]
MTLKQDGVGLSRRDFLITSTAVAGGFVLGITRHADAAIPQPMSAMPQEAGNALRTGAVALTDWVRITRDDVVTLVVSQAEMGQGISTTLPAILADELGADWSRVRLELAPTAAAYQNPRIRWQFTGNSESSQAFFDHLRHVGAAARTMLVSAAASKLGAPVAELSAEGGRVIHKASGRSLSFGELAEDASRLPVAERPSLRPDVELQLIGRSLPRVDQVAKANGTALFGIDYIPPGLSGVLFAAVRTAPSYGGKARAVKNLGEVKSMRGVVDVIILATSVAVVAPKYWQAKAALAVADIDFEAGPDTKLDSASIRKHYLDKMANGPVKVARDVKPESTQAAASGFEATYELGFQAHATLEPMNALAHVTAEGVDVWAPTQGQDLARYTLAAVLQRKPEDVRVSRSPFLGGGFGRRLLPDFIVDAAQLSRAVGKPVKVIWSREEDMRRDYFRPATLHRLQAQIDAKGQVIGVTQRLVSPTILKPVFPPLDLSNGIDPSALEGTLHTRYRVPAWRTEFHLLETPVPTSVYRTTGFGPTIFGLESFIDELAHRAKVDPLDYRRRLLAQDARALRVLAEIEKRSGWSRKLPGAGHGRGRGVAFTDAFGTVLAQVVEVTVTGSKVKVDRIVTVADPGRILDPKIVDAGLEGGAIWALSSVVKGEITFDRGGPVQTNFHEYDLLRLREAPKFETYLLESTGSAMGGIGEVGPVATVPALANALFAATGKRLRTFPLARSGLALA